MALNKSALDYRRLRHVRNNDRNLPDLPETTFPRFQKRNALSHRRGQKRMSRWIKYV